MKPLLELKVPKKKIATSTCQGGEGERDAIIPMRRQPVKTATPDVLFGQVVLAKGVQRAQMPFLPA